jgi:mono/diheme cytochrome c family protein
MTVNPNEGEATMNKRIVFSLVTTSILTLALAANAQQASPDPGVAQAAGKAAFEVSCKTCHGLDRPLSKNKSAAEWEGTADRMIKNGAAVTDEQKGYIVAYLAAKSTFVTKCSTCHSTDRPLGKSKTAADWLSTVKRMAEKKPGHLSDQEIAAVAAYLALERPAK